MANLLLETPDSPLTGTDFVNSIKGLSHAQREDAAFDALLSGNVPEHMRGFVDVTITFSDANGVGHKLVISALPDYLSIGTSTDKLRMPLWPITAQKVADAWNCVLPTTKLVTILWNAAPSKLPPQPWGPPYDSSMSSTDRYVAHNKKIDVAIAKLGVDKTTLMCGHKKNVVITKQLATKPNAVAIFGWHQSDGKPIQSLYLGHDNVYADYSHGIRLISRDCVLDDVNDDLSRIMMDPVLSVGVSSEGPLPFTQQPKQS